MTKNSSKPASPLQRTVAAAAAGLRNSVTRVRNTLAEILPGERPAWLVLELTGSFPVRKAKRKLLSIDTVRGKERELSQEELETTVTALLEADWLTGVVVRLEGLDLDWASVYTLRRQLQRLKDGGKRIVATASTLSDGSYYLASVAHEIVMPESAELYVSGMAFSKTYRAEFLKRFGIRFEKLAIREYKSAMDDLVRSEMSPGDREQLNAILDSMQLTFAEHVAAGRGREPEQVVNWVDRAMTSAPAALEAGMIDRLAYEDELLSKKHKPFSAGARYLTRQLRPASPKKVAFVSLDGAIVPGKSRQFPIPIPLFGEKMAGSETLVRALRAAGKDPGTAAVVFHVESGGGSALASDLIWREIKLLAQRMPVVAVMGAVAGSGGYYVLTHATKILAAPATITGSIGVVGGKPILQEFNARYGFNPEILKRGRFADMNSNARPWDDEERAHSQRYMDEIYDRFVARVAEGRNLTADRVNEIGRGRIWSGQDGIGVGLVDELGDVARALELAKELAGLAPNAPVWNVTPPPQYVLPVGQDAEATVQALLPLLQERVLLSMPGAFRLKI